MMNTAEVTNEGTPQATPSAPCRLSVILARNAPRALILRRGPSRWVQTILWHTNGDTFDYGQWFHGRIYECRSDLSPDGDLFIYCALKINRHALQDASYTFAWTAISRPPFLTALALWPHGNTYHGGGMFLDRHTVQVDRDPHHMEHHPKHPPSGLNVVMPCATSVLQRPAFARPDDARERLNDWTLWEVGSRGVYRRGSGWTERKSTVWQKAHPSRHFQLVRVVTGDNTDLPKNSDALQYIVEDTAGGTRRPLIGVSWADWDQKGRLTYAREGCLYATSDNHPERDVTMLADFNAQRPYELVAPEWARRWNH